MTDKYFILLYYNIGASTIKLQQIMNLPCFFFLKGKSNLESFFPALVEVNRKYLTSNWSVLIAHTSLRYTARSIKTGVGVWGCEKPGVFCSISTWEKNCIETLYNIFFLFFSSFFFYWRLLCFRLFFPPNYPISCLPCRSLSIYIKKWFKWTETNSIKMQLVSASSRNTENRIFFPTNLQCTCMWMWCS